LFFWPLLRWLGIRNFQQLGLSKNPEKWRDAGVGFLIAAVPLLLFGAFLLTQGVYSLRSSISLGALGQRTLTAIVVPFIEEPLFRGLILGVLLRSLSPKLAVLGSSAFFSILHFLKAPDDTDAAVTWTSGFNSIANAFTQFSEPLLVLAGFTTLFLLGWILADARLRTRSLWLPIGLHSGWIFASAVFNQFARREMEILPWLGRNLLIGLAPLAVALVSWWIMRAWLGAARNIPLKGEGF
nr:CPBP family intramembrane metalloprotease [Chthoniobacterales bacterium]